VLESFRIACAIGLLIAAPLGGASRAEGEESRAVAWGTNIQDGSRLDIDGKTYVVESADRRWSAMRAAEFPELIRLEVRRGDIWSEDNRRKPPKERSEFEGQQRFGGGIDIWVSYSMLIEDGPVSTAKSAILGQFHHVDTDIGTTAPYSVWLNRGDRLSVETWSSPENPLMHNPMGPSVTLYESDPIARNRWYQFVHRVRFGPDGSGVAQLWIDGAQVANYSGRLGYVGRYYWKFGIYRETAAEPIAIQYANMEVSTSTLAARIAHPKPIYAAASGASYAAASTASLPKLPLPVGAKVIGLGDSTVRANHAAPAEGQISSYGIGQLVWARALDPRFIFDTWAVAHDPVGDRGFDGANQGLDGDHTVAVRGGVPGVLSRIPYVLARNPAIVYLQVGTNDINSHESASSIERNLDRILRQLRAGNVWVLLSTIWPRSTAGVAPWPAGDPRWRTRKDVNEWINSQRGREGVRIVDANQSLTDMSAPSGEEEWRTGYSSDGVHPGPAAAYHAALAIDTVLAEMISSGSTFATDPRLANLIPDGSLAGSAGVRTSGISGAMASNWSAALTTSDGGPVAHSTVEGSKEVIEEGLEKQVFLIRPANDAGASPYLILDWTYAPDIRLDHTALSGDDWIQAALHVDVSAWDGWIDISMTLLLGDDGKMMLREDAMRPFDRSLQRWPASGWDGWLVSDPIRIPARTSINRIQTSRAFAAVAFRNTAQGTGTVKFSRPIIRKVPDPRREWNLQP
jgi:lysophospholipase L1-like esterase